MERAYHLCCLVALASNDCDAALHFEVCMSHRFLCRSGRSTYRHAQRNERSAIGTVASSALLTMLGCWLARARASAHGSRAPRAGWTCARSREIVSVRKRFLCLKHRRPPRA